ncbi:hypothetical protein [Dyella lutea]|uniref:Uncharacterized protein n=1 Tax=Dyella lutea TaxID=2950441 RepID=A0ABT1F5L0_9GAMM|nr:hypothetical protein [Dyella lutea]MCP1372666.1 hypothetical protein [Dyella lutea]
MTDTIEAWQCIGCGRVEAPQTCIGVCRDRKVQLVGLADFEQARAEAAALRARLADVHAHLQRFVLATPNEGRWEAAWLALQAQLREVLGSLTDVVMPPAG